MVISKNTVYGILFTNIVASSSGGLRRVICVLDSCSDSGTKGKG